MSSSDLKQASTSGVFWNFLQNLLGRLLGLIVTVVLARLLDQSAFGVILVALSVTAFAEVVINQGTGDFIAQRAQLAPEHLDTAFWLNVSGGLVLTLLIVALAGPIAHALEAPELVDIIRVLSVVVILRALTIVPAGVLVRKMRFRTLSIRSTVAAVAGGITGITCALLDLGVYALVAQVLVGELVSVLVLWSSDEWRPRARVSSAAARELIRFGGPLFASGLLSFATRRLDATIIANATGLARLGIYSIAQRVFQISNQILNKSADAVAFSALSRLATEPERRRAAFVRILELTAVICFPLYAGLALIAENIVPLAFGERWNPSVPVLAAFALSGLPVSLSYLHSSALKATAQTRAYLIIHVAMAVVYLPLLVVLVRHGAAAAAVAYLASTLVMIPLEVTLVRRALALRIADYVKAVRGPLLATIAMAGATYGVQTVTPSLPRLPAMLAHIATGAVVFVVSMRLFARTTFERSLDELRAIIRKKRGRG